MKKLLLIALAVALFFGALLLLKESEFGTGLIWQASRGGTLLLPLIVFSALLDSVNPCAFSVLIITLLFLFGLGLSRRRIFALGGVYIAGIFAAYFLIGLGLFQALHIFGIPHFMGKLGAALMALFGMFILLQEFFPELYLPLGIPAGAHQKMGKLIERASLPRLRFGGQAAAFLLGALVGLCEFPCTGGPYLMVVGLLHDAGTYRTGFSYLLLYNALFVLPLAVLLLAAAHRETLVWADKVRKGEMKHARATVAFLMILVGLFVLGII